MKTWRWPLVCVASGALAFACSNEKTIDVGATAATAATAAGSGGAGGTTVSSTSESASTSTSGSGGSPSDPCFSEVPGPSNAENVGCNGDPPGPICSGDYGGLCTLTADGFSWSCNEPSVGCAGVVGSMTGDLAMCFQACPDDVPGRGPYISTGGCPTGSRCLDLGTFSFCAPDCHSDADCASLNCTEEGMCFAPGLGTNPVDPCAR